MVKHNKIKKLFTRRSKVVTFKRLFVFAAILLLFTVLLIFATYGVARLINDKIEDHRESRITEIYESLSLDDSYRVSHVSIFGDKRSYEWDESRTMSSSIELVRNDTQKNTLADLKKIIILKGYDYIGQEYSGVNTQYHFKSRNDEYIRVSVMPKTIYDNITFGNFTAMSGSGVNDSESAVNITLKINLDDNNE